LDAFRAFCINNDIEKEYLKLEKVTELLTCHTFLTYLI
jgi:hypothetical protein